MTVPVSLTLSGDQHLHLERFLFPGDGNEAVALLLCGRREGDRRHRLIVREIHGIPYEDCSVRTPWRVTWPPDYIAPMLDRAASEGLSVVKIHSHPSGLAEFSETDNRGDQRLLPMIDGWVEHPVPHGSAVMLPTGEIFGRVYKPASDSFADLSCVSVAGDDLLFWYPRKMRDDAPGFLASQAQIFDEGTIERLQRLSIGVVGASGSGSPTIEQLVRLGVGELVIVDDDVVEERNLNRILNTTRQHVIDERAKVFVMQDAANAIDIGTKIVPHAANVWDPDVISSLAQCDVIFGCVDTIDGRYLLNAIAAYYSIPYFDIGVRLLADESKGELSIGISEICGTINYLRPGRSSLLSRGLFSLKDVANASLERNDPAAFEQQVNDGYIVGAPNNRPAVISVNMFASSLAVNEFLARLHPYREEYNLHYAAVEFSLASMEIFYDPETGLCDRFSNKVGVGDTKPLLDEIELTEKN